MCAGHFTAEIIQAINAGAPSVGADALDVEENDADAGEEDVAEAVADNPELGDDQEVWPLTDWEDEVAGNIYSFVYNALLL